MVRPPNAERGLEMPDVDVLTQAAKSITQGDFMGAMEIFEAHIGVSPSDPAGYHGWAEAALFEVQENGNMDEKGNDRINEGQIAAYFRKASGMDPENADYLAAYANALIEFDRIPMRVLCPPVPSRVSGIRTPRSGLHLCRGGARVPP